MEAIIAGGFVMGVLATAIIAAIVRGWVLHVLWGWFAVNALGVQPIGIAEAMGLALIVTLFTAHLAEKKTDSKSLGAILYQLAVVVFIGPMLALLMGWILYQIAY